MYNYPNAKTAICKNYLSSAKKYFADNGIAATILNQFICCGMHRIEECAKLVQRPQQICGIPWKNKGPILVTLIEN